jgi:hypothetical protein
MDAMKKRLNICHLIRLVCFGDRKEILSVLGEPRLLNDAVSP